jgi:hypothetical protein
MLFRSMLLETLEPYVHDVLNTKVFGTFRVEVVVLLFDRIIDLHNFELVMMVLSAPEAAAVHGRIGLLNVFNPCKPEGYREIDMSKWDERQLAKILVHFSIAEKGENSK